MEKLDIFIINVGQYDMTLPHWSWLIRNAQALDITTSICFAMAKCMKMSCYEL